MLAALRIAVVDLPQTQRSEIQNLFHDKGWQIIWTPPYTPETQLIEKIWAYTKHFIAKLDSPLRTLQSLLRDALKAFYGDPSNHHDGVTGALCPSLIFRTHQWCIAFIDKHMHKGENLASLAAHPAANPLEEALPLEIDDEIDDEIEAARLEEEPENNDLEEDDDRSDDG